MTFVMPKKSLGQNFLTDRYYIDRIVESFDLQPTDTVLEIGPGKGILTKEIAKKVNKLYAVEIDQRLLDILAKEITTPNFELIHKDFLDFDFANIVKEGNIKIVGNLPYHITSAIIFKVMDLSYELNCEKRVIESLTVMMQKEVADRMCAKPNTKDYGVITVLTSYFAAREILFDIPGSAFFPVPKVTSSILKFTFPQPNPNFTKFANYPELKKVIKTVFLQRRKMLRNTVKNFGVDLDLIKSVELTKRPENLTLEDFMALTQEILELKGRITEVVCDE